MAVLDQQLTARCMAATPEVEFDVEGRGSETGFLALLEGSAEIAASSRPIRETERERFVEQLGAVPDEIVVALDGISAYVHRSNPVSRLSTAQLRDIHTGKIRSRSEVGGRNARIDFYNRDRNSGTRSLAITFSTAPGSRASRATCRRRRWSSPPSRATPAAFATAVTRTRPERGSCASPGTRSRRSRAAPTTTSSSSCPKR